LSKQANLEKPRPTQARPIASEQEMGGATTRRSRSPFPMISSVLILVLTATLCGLLWYLYPLHYYRVLLICGIAWGALLIGLLLIRAEFTDDKLDRIRTRLQDFQQEGTHLLQELRREQRENRAQIETAAQQLTSLQTRLDTTSMWIEQILKTVQQPGEKNVAQWQRVESLLEMLKSQADRNAATLRQLSGAPEVPTAAPAPVSFRPSRPDLAPSPRLQEATSYYAAQLTRGGQSARVAFEALQRDARSSLDLEADLNRRGDQMLQPANSLEWERVERDIYRPLSLLVSSQEMSGEESRALYAYLEEIDAFRRTLHQLLVNRFHVQRIPILPEVTKLDPNLHNPVEDSWLKTTAPEKHLVIYEVVAAGFQRNGQLIRKATVKHYRHDKTEVKADPLPREEAASPSPPTAQRVSPLSQPAPSLPTNQNNVVAGQDTSRQLPNPSQQKQTLTPPASDASSKLSTQEEEERLKLDSDDDRVQKF